MSLRLQLFNFWSTPMWGQQQQHNNNASSSAGIWANILGGSPLQGALTRTYLFYELIWARAMLKIGRIICNNKSNTKYITFNLNVKLMKHKTNSTTHAHTRPRNAMTYASDVQTETDVGYRTTPLTIAYIGFTSLSILIIKIIIFISINILLPTI